MVVPLPMCKRRSGVMRFHARLLHRPPSLLDRPRPTADRPDSRPLARLRPRAGPVDGAQRDPGARAQRGPRARRLHCPTVRSGGGRCPDASMRRGWGNAATLSPGVRCTRAVSAGGDLRSSLAARLGSLAERLHHRLARARVDQPRRRRPTHAARSLRRRQLRQHPRVLRFAALQRLCLLRRSAFGRLPTRPRRHVRRELLAHPRRARARAHVA